MSKAFIGALTGVFLSAVPSVHARSTVDVSKEWNVHAASANARGAIVPLVTPPEAPKPVEPEGPCDCPTLTQQERLEQATYAFTGFVSEVKSTNKKSKVVMFDVDEIFKGVTQTEMKIETDVTGGGCDIPFQSGQSYLVFAKWEWGRVSTHRCMGTKYLAKAPTDALGPSESMKEKLYIRLRNACMGRRDTACCLSSLKGMRRGYYLPEPEAGCPSGFIPDRLQCSGSYTWCVPISEGRRE